MSDNQNSAAIQIHENQNSTALVQHSDYAALNIDAYLKSFPPGFRFKPTDEELVVHYLRRKIQNQKPHPSRIHDVDIYRNSPFYYSATYAAANENEWYFLSPRQKKYEMGKRPSRIAGDGYWKATGADKPISSSNVDVGVVKTLVYFQGTHKKSTKTEWIMKEYRVNETTLQEKPVNSTGRNRSNLAESSTKSMKLDDYVLYKIYKNKSNRSKNATVGEDGEANNLEEDDANVVEEGEANDQYQEPFKYFHDGVAQQENTHQDHGSDKYMATGSGQFNQVTHVDNIYEINYSANQQQQQQNWQLPDSNHLGNNNYVFPNEMSMVISQMHGNGFYDQNRELMLHEALYNQPNMPVYDYSPPQPMLPADASNNVLALNNVSNIAEEFSVAMSPVDASNNVQTPSNISTEFSAAMSPADASNINVQALSNNISEEFSAAMPPVDAPHVGWVFHNEMNMPQMQQRQYQHRLVMTRPSPSSTYHPYHLPDYPNN